MALLVQYHLPIPVLYRKYCSFSHIPAVPFLVVCDVVEIQSKLIIYGTACARPFTCWSIVQEIPSYCYIPTVPFEVYVMVGNTKQVNKSWYSIHITMSLAWY
jgi:hypothetical protein